MEVYIPEKRRGEELLLTKPGAFLKGIRKANRRISPIKCPKRCSTISSRFWERILFYIFFFS